MGAAEQQSDKIKIKCSKWRQSSWTFIVLGHASQTPVATPSKMAASRDSSALEGYHEVAKLSELKSSIRKRVTVEERVIALFYNGERVYALDHFCYRKIGAKGSAMRHDFYVVYRIFTI